MMFYMLLYYCTLFCIDVFLQLREEEKKKKKKKKKHFWQVWLKFVQRFQRRRVKCEKLTNRRTTDAYP